MRYSSLNQNQVPTLIAGPRGRTRKIFSTCAHEAVRPDHEFLVSTYETKPVAVSQPHQHGLEPSPDVVLGASLQRTVSQAHSHNF